MPAWGVRPEAMANAIARGNATRPTVTPAIRSSRNLCRSYVLSKRADFGSQFSLRKPLPILSLWQPRSESGSNDSVWCRTTAQTSSAPLGGELAVSRGSLSLGGQADTFDKVQKSGIIHGPTAVML